MNKINELKKELKQWQEMAPVNSMGSFARQTKIDSIKTQIQQLEDLGPEYDSAGFTEEDRVVNDQYKNDNL